MSVRNIKANQGLVNKEPSFKHGACIILPKKEDARNTWDLLLSILNKEGYVSVYDLYLAIGAETSTEDDLIGWATLDGTFIKPTFDRKEYRLVLPKLNCDIREF